MKPIDDIPKAFNPSDEERTIYATWEASGAFHAEAPSDKKTYTIMMPPPNITGQLHLGHALDNTQIDVLIRYHRLLGENALFLPGTDHASIATEARVVAAMEKEGITKADVGRNGFLKRAWEWKDFYNNRIVEQQKRLGISCDWARHRFTLDEGLSRAVTHVFVKLYEEGLIYRGERMINWCPDCLTSISDIEVEHESKEGALYYIRYPYADGNGDLVIATTRPETMLADTAVAVHPDDEKRAACIGRDVRLPLTDRIIPVIGDSYVDPSFGTGFVKITPAHDPNDYEIGRRHNLESINILTDDAHMTEETGPYAGMTVAEARRAVLADLKAQGFFVKEEPIVHNVGTCSRCHSVVEPKPSLQWFVRMAPLAEPAIRAVREGETVFVPEHFDKTYFNWMENIRDWCISRQLWWGHRIPAWYCDECGETIVAAEEPAVCPACGSNRLTQDEDTLDTWFSSALWPFSTLGWPEQTVDYETFYPTNVLVTGYDIIFFWVARMIFSALEHTGQVPFDTVLIHGLVRDSEGRKMSKSLNNGVDPLEVIDQYGADALRYALIYGCAPGNDQRYREEKIEAGRNFMNKLWNAFRFVRMNLGDELPARVCDSVYPEDRWIMHALKHTIEEVTQNLNRHELGLAQERVYQFLWDEFCDWYIELVKERLREGGESGAIARSVLVMVLSDTLTLLHPFMPFITERIYGILHDGEPLISASWPDASAYADDDDAAETMASLMDAIRGVRNLRAEYKVPASQKLHAVVAADDRIATRLLMGEQTLGRLAGIGRLSRAEEGGKRPEDGVSVPFRGGELLISLRDLIDIDEEIRRLEDEMKRLDGEVRRAAGMLANDDFTSKAPEHVVEAQRRKKERYEDELAQVKTRIDKLRSMSMQ